MAGKAERIPENDKLSEQEISALTAEMREAGTETPVDTQARSYDFTRSEKLSRKNLRALELVYAEIARGWGKTLSNSLNSPATVEVKPSEQACLSDYVASCREPRLVVELSMDSLPGGVFVDIPAKLGLSLVDRMAGGSGQAATEPRPLTEIERNIVRRLVGRLMTDVSAALKPVTVVSFEGPRYHDSLEDLELDENEQILVARTEWSALGAQSEVNLLIPVRCLNPILDDLAPQRWLMLDVEGQKSPGSVEGLLKSVGLTLTVELGRARIAFEDAVHMEVGDVIRLNKNVDDPLEAAIDGRVMFHVRPGLTRNRLSVQIETRAEGVGSANTQGENKSYAGAA